MNITQSDRGFRRVKFEGNTCASESSAIGEYEDSLERPGSSFLWISDLHLDREQVSDLVGALKHWLEHKRLPEPTPCCEEEEG